ncbi:sigma 54-interacting transcriptional regulator [Candidatus Liberibacter solanacearum]
MIFGLSGSGKKLIARLIHKKSSRSKGSFVFLLLLICLLKL